MTMLHTMKLATIALAGLMLAAAPARAADDIVATAEKAGSFKTLIAAAKAAGLVETLTGKGPLTVFAPTDDAFRKLPAGTLDMLLKPENKATLATILKYHVLPGKYSADRLQKAKAREYTVRTAAGVPVLFKKADGLTIAGARIAKTDIGASNGTIHIIDTVILPPAVKRTLASAPAAAAPAAKSAAPAAAPKADAPKTIEAPKTGQPAAPAPAAGKADAPKAEAPKAAVPAAPAAPAPKK
jgi:uncharacterized surface protein with fasciclin (FAS1) repeats